MSHKTTTIQVGPEFRLMVQLWKLDDACDSYRRFRRQKSHGPGDERKLDQLLGSIKRKTHRARATLKEALAKDREVVTR